jgi:hypothetical protein
MAASDISSPRTKIWLAVVGVVLVAGVAYVANIYPPSDETLVGSVVPAERYRAETSSTGLSRQTLGDESIAQFMQTDLYQQIVSDRALAALFASDAFRQALASDQFRQALASDNFKQALASDNFKQAMASDQFRAALASDAMKAAAQAQ